MSYLQRVLEWIPKKCNKEEHTEEELSWKQTENEKVTSASTVSGQQSKNDESGFYLTEATCQNIIITIDVHISGFLRWLQPKLVETFTGRSIFQKQTIKPMCDAVRLNVLAVFTVNEKVPGVSFLLFGKRPK